MSIIADTQSSIFSSVIGMAKSVKKVTIGSTNAAVNKNKQQYGDKDDYELTKLTDQAIVSDLNIQGILNNPKSLGCS